MFKNKICFLRNKLNFANDFLEFLFRKYNLLLIGFEKFEKKK